MKDAEYWAKLHVASDRREPVDLPSRQRVRVVSSGVTRVERGGFTEEKRP